tara:strand:+ start:618 stop:884 length:267 start_codon:yes stop_codon:yes gene_type:complete
MLKNIINFVLLILITIFFFIIFKYYFSNENIKNISLNRDNSENILKKKIYDIPVLIDNTNNIIEFNSGFNEEMKNKKPRNFWKLLQIK